MVKNIASELAAFAEDLTTEVVALSDAEIWGVAGGGEKPAIVYALVSKEKPALI